MPNRKLGIEMATSPVTINVRSSTPPRRIAETTPSGNPRATASTKMVSASCSVAGNPSRKASATELLK